jgi:4-amino-4-deoxy-L-arabinose transferase-like glycosyltransferase
MRAPYGPIAWAGLIVYLIALLGTLLLVNESARLWAVLLLVASAVLAVVLWGRQNWISAFPSDVSARTPVNRSRLFYLFGITSAMLLVLAADLRCAAAPTETFGLAGILWIAGIALLLCSAFFGSHSVWGVSSAPRLPRWSTWEMALLALLFVLALLSRVWKLTNFPDNIYPDEIMTGTVATQAYISPTGSPPSVFSTAWSGIDLPALWFWIVAVFLKLGGNSLSMLRLPAALFGALTVLPLYGLIRETWGRYAAIAGTAIMAFSTSNIHFSRLALNNIVPQFFWAACLFFLLRGLRSRRPLDWALAGLAAGLSEHFYYGTRLLPFILITFVAYLLVVHWRDARCYLQQFAWLTLGYLAGFGPLLRHFITHHGLYYGRGTGMMTWNRLPVTWQDLQQMCQTLWPVMSENLLGISTYGGQDITYFAPLLLPAEAALLVLGIALLAWHWRHPGAFLVLLSGLGVFFVGGLVLYPNSSPPMLAHWTTAFPACYTAIGVPIGAWVTSGRDSLRATWRWIPASVAAVGLVTLAYANVHFYFYRYYADPESLKTARYKVAQRLYEEQTAQSRYMASLGATYRVVLVGQSPYPYDPETTRYLVTGQEYIPVPDPQKGEVSLGRVSGSGLAFLFFPGSEQYRELIRQRYPGGREDEVRNRVGRHLFYAYVVGPQ